MKKVLVITYYWPPSGGAGVQRWLKFVKYLRGFGWEPVIYTPSNPEIPVQDNTLLSEIPVDIRVITRPVWEPYNLYKFFTGRKKGDRIQTAFLMEKKKPGILEKLSIWIRGNVFIPDARRFWIRPSVKFLTKWTIDNPVDLIVSTGPPHSMHLIALGIKQKTRIPWLADFRDPWTNIDYYKDLSLTAYADKRHRFLEKKVLATADAITVISKGMEKDFNAIVPRDYEVVTNGFDVADFEHNVPAIKPDKFRLSHIGSLVKTRNPKILWQALQQLLVEIDGFSNDLEISLIGSVDYSVKTNIQACQLEQYTIYKPYIPHKEVVNEYNRSSLLLLLINDTPNAGLILTGKFFEYMASRRPIVCLGPTDGDAAKIIEETNSGFAVGFDELAKLRQIIRAQYENYCAGGISATDSTIEAYSRKNLTKKMAVIMDQLVS